MGRVKGQELSANSFFLTLLCQRRGRPFGTQGICLHSMACWPLRLGGAERSSPNAPGVAPWARGLDGESARRAIIVAKPSMRDREPATYSFLFAFVSPPAHPRSFNVTLQLIYLIRGGAPLLNRCDARRINLHGDFDVKNETCNKHPLSFGAPRCDEREAWTHGDTSWQAYEALGKLRPSFRPSRTARAFR
jgi:hypothetical protein